MVDLESIIFEERLLYDYEMLYVFISSCDENEGNQMFAVSNENFQIYRHSLGMDCWKLFGDPIYETDGDDSRE